MRYPTIVFALALAQAMPGASASSTACLDIRTVTPSPGMSSYRLTVQNKCGKPITAYDVDVTITRRDGTSMAYSGAGQDFFDSIQYAGASTPGHRFGQIAENEVLTTPRWQAPGARIGIVGIKPAISAVVFGDSSGVGNEQLINDIFDRRRYLLAELRFWRARLNAIAPTGRNSGPLRSLVEGIDLDQRKREAPSGKQKGAIEGTSRMINEFVRNLQRRVDTGKISTSDAWSTLKQYLNSRITASEHHTVRRAGL